MPVVGGNERDSTSVKVLINRITELENLQEAKIQVVEIISIQ
jgi:hypothetical protein